MAASRPDDREALIERAAEALATTAWEASAGIKWRGEYSLWARTRGGTRASFFPEGEKGRYRVMARAALEVFEGAQQERYADAWKVAIGEVFVPEVAAELYESASVRALAELHPETPLAGSGPSLVTDGARDEALREALERARGIRDRVSNLLEEARRYLRATDPGWENQSEAMQELRVLKLVEYTRASLRRAESEQAT